MHVFSLSPAELSFADTGGHAIRGEDEDLMQEERTTLQSSGASGGFGCDDLERRDFALGGPSALAALTESVWYAPYVRDITHCHNCLEIGMCVDGRGKLLLGGAQEIVPFSPGTITVIPAGMFHSQQNEGDAMTRWRYISVDAGRLVHELPSALRSVIEPFFEAISSRAVCMQHSRQAAQASGIICMMYEMKSRSEGEILPEHEALLLYLLAVLSREPVARSRSTDDPQLLHPIEPALNYICAHFESELRVAQMAKACAMSESHFRRTFAQIMGVSPLEYLNRYRIQRAKEMLHASRRPVQNIATDCGFVSIATFNRNFMRYVGYSPSDWRQMKGETGKTLGDALGLTDV